MLPGLTKDDVAKLSDEQREVIAQVALKQSRTTLELQEKAGGYFGFHLVPIVFLLAMFFSGALQTNEHLLFAIIGLTALIQFHAVATNKRIDAALRLIEMLQAKPIWPGEAPAEARHDEPR